MVIGFGFAALLISIVAWLSVRRVERELQRLNGELAARAEERQSLVHQILFAQEDERRSVAHEIHDGPAQQLAAARMLVDAFEAGIELDPESSSADYLDRAKRYLDLSLVETRRIISGLRPAPLDDLGLAAALHELLTDLTAPTEMDFSLGSAELDGQLSPAAETALYRVAQEAANNALKHSGGTHLSVSLRSERSLAHLRVQDDGAGFDLSELEQPNGERFGLIGMRERIDLLDGELGIQSSSTGGTLVTATLPLSDVG